ncbi:peptidase inhibitor family I36 protein [Actinosynnema sp. NPDC023794]
MRRAITRMLVVCGLIAAVSTTAVTSGTAAEGNIKVTQQQVDQLLDLYPGSHQISPTGVEVEKGVIVSVPAEFGAQATCSYEYLCLFSDRNYSGYQLSFSICTFRNLGDYAYPGGGYWYDKVSSFINNQTTGTWSDFYNWDGYSDWVYLFSSQAYDARNPTPYENIIDAVWVC